ncbi:uncharacterized protein EI90DRAFT_1382885 [Cantharellus anzutake]|uniref:uncharacterized protein n=1 Tax=Cantharellus anzutake TaxID=1750568 RepID=UPI0019053987|nr:uncharacterized protein EI90DRAFT_1382885 [Cantharellus anzutake]KAF8329347.1 hypothetical protein EI90DRAFT_1382885 [Cantharellus anzutake]
MVFPSYDEVEFPSVMFLNLRALIVAEKTIGYVPGSNPTDDKACHCGMSQTGNFVQRPTHRYGSGPHAIGWGHFAARTYAPVTSVQRPAIRNPTSHPAFGKSLDVLNEIEDLGNVSLSRVTRHSLPLFQHGLRHIVRLPVLPCEKLRGFFPSAESQNSSYLSNHRYACGAYRIIATALATGHVRSITLIGPENSFISIHTLVMCNLIRLAQHNIHS